MGTRESAVARALSFFDSNGFRDRLAELVAIPGTSHDPGDKPDVPRYLGWAYPPLARRARFHSDVLDAACDDPTAAPPAP